jgi:ion channel-forming bestrophin family protein
MNYEKKVRLSDELHQQSSEKVSTSVETRNFASLHRLLTLNRDRRVWFRTLLQLQGSVIPSIFPRVLVSAIFSFFVSWFYALGFQIALELDKLVPSIILSLLLVFRTNTAYERFWEGRKAWGTLINTVRNFSRTIWTCIEEQSPEDRKEKIATLRLLVAFAIATKLHLRSEPISPELSPFLSSEQYEKLKTMNNPPLEVAFWIGDYLQQQHDKGYVNVYQLTNMLKLLDTMVEVLGICERILKTPIPLAYSIHLKQLIFIYCFILPFQLVSHFHWLTSLVVALISFTVFGIEEIGIEIENPFGCDLNDLPLNQICETMQTNIEDLITLSPCVRRWKKTSDRVIE